MAKSPLLSLALCIALFLSCSKQPDSCFTPPEPIYMRFLDENGNDLLNPANPDGYKLSNVRLHYMENGKKVNSKVMLDSLPDTKSYFLKTDISFKADKGRNFSLQLSPTVTDNIYLRYDHVSENRCAFFRFVEFKYNDVIYTMKETEGNFQAFKIVR